MSRLNLQRYLSRSRGAIETFLEEALFSPGSTDRLHEAMRYSLFAGGKRLRPILTLAAADAVGGARSPLIVPYAAAIEMIHTYSLIHDDLPAMDDDALRRGKPTNHVVFGEALAILAGDALLTEAFRVMGAAARSAGRHQLRAVQVLTEIAAAAGARGMVAGQAADMDAEHRAADLPTVEFIHVRKTGELIRAAVRAGALLGGARLPHVQRLTRYAEFIGLAFQVADDILDEEGATTITGKTQGRDRLRRKATFPAVLGMPEAKQRARELLANGIRALDGFDAAADPLRQIGRMIVRRALTH